MKSIEIIYSNIAFRILAQRKWTILGPIKVQKDASS